MTNINSGSPFDMDDVPDKVLGSRRVTRIPTGEIITLPGGNQGGVTVERTQNIPPFSHPNGACPPQPFYDNTAVVKQLPYLEPPHEAEYVHAQRCLDIFGETDGIPPFLAVPFTTNVDLYRVPESLVLFVEKWLIQMFDSDFETLDYIPHQNGNPVRALIGNNITAGNEFVHMPTLPQGQRNTTWEYGPQDLVSVQLINRGGATRRVCVGFVGWEVNLNCIERKLRG